MTDPSAPVKIATLHDLDSRDFGEPEPEPEEISSKNSYINVQEWSNCTSWTTIIGKAEDWIITGTASCSEHCHEVHYKKNTGRKTAVAHDKDCSYNDDGKGTGCITVFGKSVQKMLKMHGDSLSKWEFIVVAVYHNDPSTAADKESVSSITSESASPTIEDRVQLYALNNFSCKLKQNGAIYWSEKGSGIFTESERDIRNDIKVNAVPGRKVKDGYIDDVLMELQYYATSRVNNGVEEYVDPQARYASDAQGNIWIDTKHHGTGFVKITKDGWENHSSPGEGLAFERSSYIASMPIERAPISALVGLLEGLNTSFAESGSLLAWAILPLIYKDAPIPMMMVQGAYGTGKSTVAWKFHDLVDPSESRLIDLPKNGQEKRLFVTGRYAVSYDNLDPILPRGMNSYLCRNVTQTSFQAKKLFKDKDMIIDKVRVAQIATAIAMPNFEPDMVSRLVPVYPRKLRGRIKDSLIVEEWKRNVPRYRGALLELAVETMRVIADNDFVAVGRTPDYSVVAQAVGVVLCDHGVIEDADILGPVLEKQVGLLSANLDPVVKFMVSSDSVRFVEGTPGQVFEMVRGLALDAGEPSAVRWDYTGRRMGSAVHQHMDILHQVFDVDSIKTSDKGREGYRFVRRDKPASLIDILSG